MAEKRPQPSWSDIPLELAGLVLCRLPAHVDRVRFAAVCPQWRSAARQVPLPLLALQDGTVYSLPQSEPFRFPACAGYADACGNWLVFSGEDGCFLRDPFSNATVTIPALSRVHVQYADDESRRLAWMDSVDVKHLAVRKVMFCSPCLIAAFVTFQQSVKIAVCQPGAVSWWSVCVDRRFLLFLDIAFHQGKLYAIDCRPDNLFAIDISMDHITGDPRVSQIQRVISRISHPGVIFTQDNVVIKTIYLVGSDSALLMVCRAMYGMWNPARAAGGRRTFDADGRNEFEVFKADFEKSQWTKVTTIGDDQVLFLRRRCSRSLCVSQHEMPGDRIIFMENDDEDHNWYNEESSSSCSVYDMKDGNVSTLLPTVSWMRGIVPATWLFPQD